MNSKITKNSARANSLKLALLFYILTFFSSQAENLVVNGSFEDGLQPLPPDSFTIYEVGSTNLPGWIILDNNVQVDVWNRGLTNQFNSLDLHGLNGRGSIQQFVKTTPGRKYKLNFGQSAQPYPDNASNPRLSRVLLSVGNSNYVFSFNTTGVTFLNLPLSFETHQIIFTADEAETKIQFQSLDSTNSIGFFRGPEIDDISVETYLSSQKPLVVSINKAVQISWQSALGARYQVQRSAELDETWNDLGAPIDGSGSVISIFDNTSDASNNYYRIVEL